MNFSHSKREEIKKNNNEATFVHIIYLFLACVSLLRVSRVKIVNKTDTKLITSFESSVKAIKGEIVLGFGFSFICDPKSEG